MIKNKNQTIVSTLKKLSNYKMLLGEINTFIKVHWKKLFLIVLKADLLYTLISFILQESVPKIRITVVVKV